MTEKTLKDCIDVIKNSLEKKAEVGGTVSFKKSLFLMTYQLSVQLGSMARQLLKKIYR